MPEIPQYNLHQLPILDDYSFAPNFEMLYASSDAASPFFANRIFADADKESKELRKSILDYRSSKKEEETSIAEGCTYYKLWIPTIFVKEIKTNSKQGER